LDCNLKWTATHGKSNLFQTLKLNVKCKKAISLEIFLAFEQNFEREGKLFIFTQPGFFCMNKDNMKKFIHEILKWNNNKVVLYYTLVSGGFADWILFCSSHETISIENHRKPNLLVFKTKILQTHSKIFYKTNRTKNVLLLSKVFGPKSIRWT
jgi:hypothetical protein